jgi:hypothetical protein
MVKPVLIEPDAIYDDGALRQTVGLKPSALATARRSGLLRHARIGQRTVYRGEWIIEWINSASTQAARRPEGGAA